MGSGASLSREPNLDDFKSVTIEYNKLRKAGLTINETYLIFDRRLSKNQLIFANPPPAVTETKEVVIPKSITKDLPSTEISDKEEMGTVLLIDDSVTGTKISSKLLSSLSLNVLSANSAKKGFEILLKQYDKVQLILLDIIMPEDDGIACLTWIKEHEKTKHIPVYMLSGLEDGEIEKVCLNKGAKGMILKPITIHRAEDILETCNIKHSKILKKNGASTNVPNMIANASDAMKPETAKIPESKIIPGQSPRAAQSSATIQEMNKILTSNMKSPAAIKGYKMLYDSHQTLINTFICQHDEQSLSEQNKENEILSPSFQLIDSDLNPFYFPVNEREESLESIKNTLFVFLPTIFCAELYEENVGVLSLLAHYYQEIQQHSQHLRIVIITSDLPFALRAAKTRFQLPFLLVSDVQLSVLSKFSHLMNIGRVMAKFTLLPGAAAVATEEVMEFICHEQNSFIGAMLSIALVSSEREMLAAWAMHTLDCKESEIQPHHLFQFPVDFHEYFHISEEDFSRKNKFQKVQTITAAMNAAANKQKKKPNQRMTTHNLGKEKATATSQVHAKENKDNKDIKDNKDNKDIKDIKEQAEKDPRRASVLQKHQFDVFDTTVGNKSLHHSSGESQQQTSKSKKKKPRRVLVVDDSAVSSRMVSRQLEKQSFIVSVTYNGQLALEILQREEFDVVLCDVFMPVCDGVSFLTQLFHKKPYLARTPSAELIVLMISGMDDSELTNECLKLGAREVLKKPFAMDKFLEVLERC